MTDSSVQNPNATFASHFATMGPLQPASADPNGNQVPAGFTTRLLAEYNNGASYVRGSDGSDLGYAWHSDPDGGATFAMPDGGWIYVSNCESRDSTSSPAAGAPYQFSNRREDVELAGALAGGVSALRFDAQGNLIDAYSVQDNITTNCSGGATPWGTWINGEEIVDGYMFECSHLRDGGDMPCMVLLPDRTTISLLRLPGEPSQTEVTGVAIRPDGRRIYVSGQRSCSNDTSVKGFNVAGVTYEITMPFQVRVDRPMDKAMPCVS